MNLYKTTPKRLSTIHSLKLHEDSRLSWDISQAPTQQQLLPFQTQISPNRMSSSPFVSNNLKQPFMTTAPTITKYGAYSTAIKVSDFKQTQKKFGDATLRDDDAFSFASDPASEGRVTNAINILDHGVSNKQIQKCQSTNKPTYLKLYEESGKKRKRLELLSNTMAEIKLKHQMSECTFTPNLDKVKIRRPRTPS